MVYVRNYRVFRKKLCWELLLQILLLSFIYVNIDFINEHMTIPTAPIYVTYKYWWLTFNYHQGALKCKTILVVLALMVNPRLSFSLRLLKVLRLLTLLNDYLILPITFYSVFLLHILTLLLDSLGAYSNIPMRTDSDATTVEVFLHWIIVFQMAVAALIIIFECYRRATLQQSRTSKILILHEFEKAKKEKWKAKDREKHWS